MRIYISGKITGDDNYIDKFYNAERMLKKLYPDAKVINPVKITAHLLKNSNWETFMLVCITELMRCDTIYLLNDWTKSKGANIERDLAYRLNYEILSEY